MPYTNSPLITVKRNVYAVKLNDEVVYRPCMEGIKRYRLELFSNRVISSGWVAGLVCGRFGCTPACTLPCSSRAMK